eukprot:1054118-Prorocentrum_minimum.AAC.1
MGEPENERLAARHTDGVAASDQIAMGSLGLVLPYAPALQKPMTPAPLLLLAHAPVDGNEAVATSRALTAPGGGVCRGRCDAGPGALGLPPARRRRRRRRLSRGAPLDGALRGAAKSGRKGGNSGSRRGISGPQGAAPAQGESPFRPRAR